MKKNKLQYVKNSKPTAWRKKSWSDDVMVEYRAGFFYGITPVIMTNPLYNIADAIEHVEFFLQHRQEIEGR